MVPPTTLSAPEEIVYPESDGEPMADNSKQFTWILVLAGNLAALFHDRDDVFVGGNLFWYPVRGEPGVRNAPDVLVVFGRPRGHRPSYKQWEENDVPMTVVFEILSPGNTLDEMDDKHGFYEKHGVEEYYLYNPDSNRLQVYLRQGQVLLRRRPSHGFVSPRLAIRFDLSGPEMVVYGPDGERFLSFEELKSAREDARKQATQAEQKATQAEQKATQAEQRAARLAELSRKARRGQATPAELQELERLEEEPSPPAS